ncbi:MAG: hypothetical protein V5B78_08565 [Desulfohalobiaceae bacterium]
MLEQELEEFLKDWNEDGTGMRGAFDDLLGTLRNVEGVELSFKARPGVSYSLRATHSAQQERSLFAMIDVIDDDPANRWLSVCFFGDMVSDPEEKGDLIPGGLLGGDGYCFDLDTAEESEVAYVAQRIREALEAAAQG